MKVEPYGFYANTTAPTVPAALGIQSISGLTDVDRFFTQAQLASGDLNATPGGGDCGDDEDDAVINPLCIDVRAGGYFPADLRGLYDITGHGFDGTGQTIGFTLWTAAERQAAMTAFATDTGDTADHGRPELRRDGQLADRRRARARRRRSRADHLLFILENGNSTRTTTSARTSRRRSTSRRPTASRRTSAMKYYASECATDAAAGLRPRERRLQRHRRRHGEAMEDAANDPTLHSVSNSWALRRRGRVGR